MGPILPKVVTVLILALKARAVIIDTDGPDVLLTRVANPFFPDTPVQDLVGQTENLTTNENPNARWFKNELVLKSDKHNDSANANNFRFDHTRQFLIRNLNRMEYSSSKPFLGWLQDGDILISKVLAESIVKYRYNYEKLAEKVDVPNTSSDIYLKLGNDKSQSTKILPWEMVCQMMERGDFHKRLVSQYSELATSESDKPLRDMFYFNKEIRVYFVPVTVQMKGPASESEISPRLLRSSRNLNYTVTKNESASDSMTIIKYDDSINKEHAAGLALKDYFSILWLNAKDPNDYDNYKFVETLQSHTSKFTRYVVVEMVEVIHYKSEKKWIIKKYDSGNSNGSSTSNHNEEEGNSRKRQKIDNEPGTSLSSSSSSNQGLIYNDQNRIAQSGTDTKSELAGSLESDTRAELTGPEDLNNKTNLLNRIVTNINRLRQSLLHTRCTIQ